MNQFRILIIFLLALSGGIHAQQIIVTDKTTQQTIPGVAIYNHDKSIQTTTNARGEVPVSAFRSSDTLYFRHIGYALTVIHFTQLQGMNYKVALNESTVSIGEIVVSANRWEENQLETPYRIDKITPLEVSFQNPQTAADLLGTGGYAYIQKSQLGGGSPILRGFATNRVLLVVDNVRMNNAIFRTGNVQNVISLDANAMESTEILFGPGAVMYGSDAIGGVMDFHTLQPRFSDSSGVMITGNAFGRYSSANSEKTGHVDFNIGLKKFAFVTSFTYGDYDDLKTGSHGNSYFLRPAYVETFNTTDSMIVNSDPQEQIESDYSQINLMQKVLFQASENLNFDYGFHYSETSDVPRYDRLCLDDDGDGILDFAEWYYGPQKWMMNRLGVTHSAPTTLYDQFRVVVAMQNYEESRNDRRFDNARIRNQTESVDGYSLNLDLDKQLSDKASLFYGAEYIYNKIGSVAERKNIETGEITPTNTRYPDGSTWQSYGAYLNLKYHLNPEWIVNAGIRYTYYMAEADFDTSQFPFPFVHAENNNGAFNGSLGVVYNPDDTWQLYANAATGFRAPNIDDIGKVFESEPGSVVVPNPDLEPEYAYNFELGTAKKIGNCLKFDISLFYTLLDNALARRDFQYNGQDSIIYDGEMSNVQAIQNISKVYIYGVQAGFELDFGYGFGLSSVISYQYGEEQSGDSLIYYPKSHLPPIFGSTHLTWQRKSLKFDFYADYNSKLEYEDLSLNDRNDDAPFAKDANGLPYVPSWYTLNFKAGWYINKNLSVNAGVENITDQLYRPYASGISAPGINFIGALKVKF